jgi:coproporphyrinogen III oxidase-like Fe-S oxidoreductase
LAIAGVRAAHGVDVLERWGSALQPPLEAGLLVSDGTRLWLTRHGMLLANEILELVV